MEVRDALNQHSTSTAKGSPKTADGQSLSKSPTKLSKRESMVGEGIAASQA